MENSRAFLRCGWIQVSVSLASFGSASAPFAGRCPLGWKDGCCSCSPHVYSLTTPSTAEGRPTPQSYDQSLRPILVPHGATCISPSQSPRPGGWQIIIANQGPPPSLRVGAANYMAGEGEGGSLTRTQGIFRKGKWMPENHSYPL